MSQLTQQDIFYCIGTHGHESCEEKCFMMSTDNLKNSSSPMKYETANTKRTRDTSDLNSSDDENSNSSKNKKKKRKKKEKTTIYIRK